ncbi:MAG: S9 family peptidase, partial [Ilumatobacteraceae bacterium]
MSAPVAKRITHLWSRPSGSVDDHFAWLADRDDPDTVAYLEAENAHTTAWFDQRSDLVDELYDQIRSRVQETDVAAPVPVDDWYYSARTVEGESYPIHCRGRSADGATDELVLDQNKEAEHHDYFDVGAFEVSPDHRLLAWSCDVNGDEHYTLRIRDIAHQHDLDDELLDTTWAGVAWSSDGTHVFYVEADEQERPYRVMRHRLGTPQGDDVEVFVDHDERFFVGVGTTRSREWIIVHAGSKQSAEAWLVPAGDPEAAATCVREREDDLEYAIDHWGDRFVVVTNQDAIDFRVMEAPLDHPGSWSELVPHEPGRRITHLEPFAGHLAIHVWHRAQPGIRVLFRDGSTRGLHIDPEPHDIEFGPNERWDTPLLRLGHQSLTQPNRVIDVDVHTGEITLVKQTPTPNVELDRYVAARHWAEASDGTKIPVDIVRRADTALDGTAAVCIYGYGSYEASMPPWFSAARVSLLDRGVVWALVHPRGGGELGRQWYLDGKLLAKRNTFTDTLAACEYLVTAGVASRDRVAIRGGSAGGLLVGACVTMEPARFRAAIAEVPFVDVTTTMSDPTLPLTVTEWEEWGDPRVEPFASYIASYSPYDNTVAAPYPAMYVSGGLNDPRVGYHEPAKWVARLREVRTNDAP